jgi:hypothetical protein
VNEHLGYEALGDTIKKAHDKLRAEGAAAERARIVAWLRAGHCKTMADAIERGAHKEPRP